MPDNIFARAEAAPVALGIVFAMAVANRFGAAVGRHRHRQGPPGPEVAHAASLAQACLALSSLLLAFSFATAYSKYEARRVATVDEANAIGTLATRLSLAPEPARGDTTAILKEYVRLHLVAAAPGLRRPERLAKEREIRAVQERLVDATVAFLRTPAGLPLVVAISIPLDETCDLYEARIAGLDARVPGAVLLLMLVVFVTSFGLLGWSDALSQGVRPRSTFVFLGLVGFALYVTFDLDHPWTGMSRVSELPMRRLAESLGVE